MPLADALRIIPSFLVHEVLASHDGGMSKTYREWSPNQPSFFPPSPQDWLPEDDLVYFLIDTVATIDLSAHLSAECQGPRIRLEAIASGEDDRKLRGYGEPRSIDVIGNKESVIFSTAACDSPPEGCVIHKPPP